VAPELRQRAGSLSGRGQDIVSTSGLTCLSADGASCHWTWDGFSRVAETERAFYLMTDRDLPGEVLQKRGLADPGLIPELRDFLRRSVENRGRGADDSATQGTMGT
jgi:hypothetical protein